MSVEAMAIVLHHSRAKGTDKVILLGIANHDGDGGAWPSIGTLEKYGNVARKNVQQALRRLEQMGEIRTFANEGGTHRTAAHERPNRYEILVRCPDTCDGTSQHRTVEGATPALPPRATPATPRGATPATPEPSYEPSNEPSMKMGARRGGSRFAATAEARLEDIALLHSLLDDNYDVADAYRTLMEEHGAEWPGAFANKLDADFHWDGFLGRHSAGRAS